MINCNKKSGWISVAIVATTLLGCAQSPPHEDRYYRLEATAPQAGVRLLTGSLEVRRFSADDLTSGRAIVYTKQGQRNELMSYHYHFWVESPAVMLQQQLVKYLRASNVAESITTPELRLRPNYVVNGRIQRLERIVSPNPAVAITLDLVAKPAQGGTSSMLVRTYELEITAADSGISSAVIAMNQGITEIYGKFLRDLTLLVSPVPASGAP